MQEQGTAERIDSKPSVRQYVEIKRKLTTIRPRETSSVMMPTIRRGIEDSMRAGREPKYVAADFSATQVLCVWLWARMMFTTMDRRLAALEDGVAPSGARMRLAA